MDIRAVVCDVNGTLVRILTEDGMDQIFRAAAHFLTYQGIHLHRDEVRDLYFRMLKEQQRTSAERVSRVRRGRHLAHDHRRSRDRLHPRPAQREARADAAVPGGDVPRDRAAPAGSLPVRAGGARRPARALPARPRHRCPELPTRAPNCTRWVCSTTSTPSWSPGTTGTASPTRGSSEFALDRLGVAAENALYVGNDMRTDIFGAREVGHDDGDVRLRSGDEGPPGLRAGLHDHGFP